MRDVAVVHDRGADARDLVRRDRGADAVPQTRMARSALPFTTSAQTCRVMSGKSTGVRP